MFNYNQLKTAKYNSYNSQGIRLTSGVRSLPLDSMQNHLSSAATKIHCEIFDTTPVLYHRCKPIVHQSSCDSLLGSFVLRLALDTHNKQNGTFSFVRVTFLCSTFPNPCLLLPDSPVAIFYRMLTLQFQFPASRDVLIV